MCYALLTTTPALDFHVGVATGMLHKVRQNHPPDRSQPFSTVVSQTSPASLSKFNTMLSSKTERLHGWTSASLSFAHHAAFLVP